jgi:hypothetical protein
MRGLKSLPREVARVGDVVSGAFHLLKRKTIRRKPRSTMPTRSSGRKLEADSIYRSIDGQVSYATPWLARYSS